MKSCLGLGCLVTLLATVALAVALAVTCPKPAEHYKALNELVGHTIESQAASSDGLAQQVIAALGRVAYDQVGSGIVERMVHVDDYVVVSIGRMHWQGEDHVVSVGILGHVVTPSEAQLAEAVREAL
jgi:hypothetical protein